MKTLLTHMLISESEGELDLHDVTRQQKALFTSLVALFLAAALCLIVLV